MHALIASLFGLLLVLVPDGGWLGVYLAPDRTEAAVLEVVPDSPAAKAGLRAGDVILAVGDRLVPTREKLMEVISKASPGDRVTLKLQRDGKETIAVCKLGTRPDENAVQETAAPTPAQSSRGGRPTPSAEARPSAPQDPAPAKESAPAAGGVFLGIAVEETDRGLEIERVLNGSPAAAAGLRSGEQLKSLGGRKLSTLADLDRALAGARPGNPLEVVLQSGDGVRSIHVVPGSRGKEAATGPGVDELLTPAPESAPAARAQVRRLPVARTEEAVPVPAKEAAKPTDIEGEIAALRAELRDLKKQLEDLRKQIRKE